MIGKIAAVAAAAICANFLVMLNKPHELNKPNEVPVATAPQIAIEQDFFTASGAGAISCVKDWPYYESSCLRNGRQADEPAHSVRIISTAHSVSMRAGQTMH
jgi:hypothetical protein